MRCGVRAEGAMRGAGCARLRRAGAGESGAERGEGRERAQGRETASPMVLHCGILWERR